MQRSASHINPSDPTPAGVFGKFRKGAPSDSSSSSGPLVSSDDVMLSDDCLPGPGGTSSDAMAPSHPVATATGREEADDVVISHSFPTNETEQTNSASQTSPPPKPPKKDMGGWRTIPANPFGEEPTVTLSSPMATPLRQRPTTSKEYNVVFCGTAFPSGYEFTKQLSSESRYAGVFNVVRVQSIEDPDYASQIANAHVIVPFMWRVDKKLLNLAPNLKLVIQYGVGVEGVDIDECTRRGIYVSNIPADDTGNARACAEHALYLTLALARYQKKMADSLSSGGLGWPTGMMLRGKTVLIYGCGALGTCCAKLFSALGMTVLAIKRSPWKVIPAEISEAGSPHDLEAFGERADVVVLTCTQNASSMRVVNHEFISRMKRGFLLINIARGGLCDYNAVKRALDSGSMGGFGTDVWQVEPFPTTDTLLRHERVVATPHVAGVTDVSYRNMARIIMSAIDRVVRHGQPPEVKINDPLVRDMSSSSFMTL